MVHLPSDANRPAGIRNLTSPKPDNLNLPLSSISVVHLIHHVTITRFLSRNASAANRSREDGALAGGSHVRGVRGDTCLYQTVVRGGGWTLSS